MVGAIMKASLHVAIGLCAAALAATPLRAHHSWSTNYDLTETKRIYGTVDRVIFQSPHSAILIDVETDDGRSERWRVEWGSPGRLRERGVDEHTLRAGDEVAISGHPHRDPATKSLHFESLVRASDGLQL
jgi:uncharacterized protein DUF6152